jgi:hypothetical protein
MTPARWLARSAIAALAGALAGAACLTVAYQVRPGIALQMDHGLPGFATGFYAVERAGDRGFAWTGPRADLALDGLDRRTPWRCLVRFRGARPNASFPQPDVVVAIDGVAAARRRATNEFEDVEVQVPARRSAPGLHLSIASSPAFVPGPGDRRTLGVQVERIACAPSGGRLVFPPARATAHAAAAGGAFGLAAAAGGLPLAAAAAAALGLAVAQSVPLVSAGALYGTYSYTLARLAAATALAAFLALALLGAFRRRGVDRGAAFVVLCSAAVFYLELLGLLHPSKNLVDAVFHAHRFEAVLGGHFYFTQLSTSATAFPYAIGLYLVAAPWSLLTRDHVTLLRVVVAAAQVLAGVALYLMVVRTWGDRLAAAVAVALFHLVPVTYLVVGNANLTNAFGASAGAATVAAAAIWAAGRRGVPGGIALALLATLALISHVSTVTLLVPTLLALAVFLRSLGGPAAWRPARGVVLVTAVAAVCSVVVYYGHFGDLYRAQIARAGGTRAAEAPAARAAAPAAAPADGRPELGRTRLPLERRAADAASQTAGNLGWPILVLAALGAWRLAATRARGALASGVAAWAAVGLLFVTLSVVSAADVRYQQDAWEFIGRVEQATFPAAAILGGVAAAWAWRTGLAARAVAVFLLGAAVVPAARVWLGWIS